MQRLVAKYGAAAHLALLAVAPLFLCPFLPAGRVGVVMLWLALLASLWMLMEPSLRVGEMLHVARRRVIHEIVVDPLFWFFAFAVLLTGVRALNAGIGMAYDAEMAVWKVAPAAVQIFPGSVGDAGFLPFAGVLSLAIVVQGCLHSLGRSARMAFLLVATALGGGAAVLDLFLKVPPSGANAGLGLAFSIYFLGALVALFSAFDLRWRLVMPFFAFAIGGTAAGMFAYTPSFVVGSFAAAGALVLLYVFVCAARSLPAAGEFKLLVVMGIALTLGALLVATVLPADVLNARLAEFTSLSFFPEKFFERRGTLSAVALKSWLDHLWIGTGIGSFPLDFRFGATAENWQLVRKGVVSLPNGWLLLLAERGLVGLLMLVVPVLFLSYFYVRRAVRAMPLQAFPHPACALAPVALSVLVPVGFFDEAFLRADALLAAGALMAIAARSFGGAGGARHG